MADCSQLRKKRNKLPSPAVGVVETVSVGEVCDDTLNGDGGFDIDPLYTLPLDDEFGTNATTADLMDLLDVGL